MKAQLAAYKAKVGCEVCGEKDPVVLDFHHEDPAKKDQAVASMTNQAPDRVWAEVLKCKVLCANDHRREHAKRA